MKIASLLLQHLISNGSLSLAGIGRFTLNKELLPAENPRQQNAYTAEIRFEQNPSEKIDDSLVDYIGKNTGKMKSLAESDISSYTDQIKEFLNIGKPFLIEGLGSLTKFKSGIIEFDAGNILIDKTKELPDSGIENPSKIQVADERHFDYNDILTSRKPKRSSKNKVLLSLVVTAGLALAVWGGYHIYKSSSSDTSAAVSVPDSAETPRQQDPVPQQQGSDSLNRAGKESDTLQPTAPVSAAVTTSASRYKFIIKEGPLNTALRRYNYLKNECKLDVYMDTRDSSLYKVFFQLPATSADTARISDSLNVLYISRGQQRVRVENL